MAELNIKDYLFFDIETHRVNEWGDLSKSLQTAFINHYFDPDSYETPEDQYKEVAGLHAEFSKVICVCFGYENSEGKFTKFSVTDNDFNEVNILKQCASIFQVFKREGYSLAGHNINACDCPYLVKRYIINNMKVPEAINHYGLKPWEITDLDSMQLWKFGQWSNVSLEVICASLGISCKEGDLTGANLYTYPISQVPINDLVKYCMQDVESNYLMVKHIFNYL